MTGQQFGHYEVESRLGAGGMGVVYLARDIRLKRRVAIKVLADGRVADELARARFRREAQALSRLNHPNIATIYDFDQQDGRDFLVMEYIEGRSLRDVGPDPLPPADVVRLGTQLAEALVAAHGAGVVHLDLKPGNMMLTADGRLKVLDFGIARLHTPDLGDGSTHTRPFDTTTLPSAAGTPPYMAPEQVAAGPVDSRTDIYAAGATLYELATGHRVFDQPRGAGLNEAILRNKPDPPSQLNPGIPAILEDALMKALEKQPGKRQQTARELLHDFQTAADTYSAIAARPHRRWRRREIVLTAAAVLTAVAVTGYAILPTPIRATFHARDFVLVGDLENATPDPLLSRTVQQALSISLQQSKFVNLVSRDRVVDALALMKRPATAAIDEPTGRDICQRESVPALISGSVTRSGSRTRIAVRVIEAGSGSLLYIGTAEYQKPEELFGRLDDLARDLREHLGESLDAIAATSQPLQKVTTGSLEALRQYSKSVDARAMGELDAVEPPLLAALQLDPEFAMAHLKLADYYAGTGNVAKAQPEIDDAYRRRDRVTDRESHFIEAQYFQSRGDFVRGRDTLKVLTALYPDDPDAHYELALMHYALEELKPGIAELRRVIMVHPHSARAHGTLALLLARDNRPLEAIDATRAALALGVDSPYLYWARGLALVGAGQVDEARADFERLARTQGFYSYLGRLQQARLALFAGDIDGGMAKLNALADSAHGAQERAFELTARVQLALGASLGGNGPLVRAQAAAIETLTAHDEASPVEIHDAGMIGLLAGDTALAERELARLANLEAANPTPLVRMARLLLAGDLARQKGKPADAVRLQDDALAQLPLHRYARGRAEAREALGDWPGAVAAWRTVLDARGQIIQDGFPPDLATAQARLDRAGARLKLASNGKDD